VTGRGKTVHLRRLFLMQLCIVGIRTIDANAQGTWRFVYLQESGDSVLLNLRRLGHVDDPLKVSLYEVWIRTKKAHLTPLPGFEKNQFDRPSYSYLDERILVNCETLALRFRERLYLNSADRLVRDIDLSASEWFTPRPESVGENIANVACAEVRRRLRTP
jgi:hypothetical protein